MSFFKTFTGPFDIDYTLGTRASGDILAQFVTMEKLDDYLIPERNFNLDAMTITYSTDTDTAIVDNDYSDVVIVPFSMLKQRFDATVARLIEAGLIADADNIDDLFEYDGAVFKYPADDFANALMFIQNIIDVREKQGFVTF